MRTTMDQNLAGVNYWQLMTVTAPPSMSICTPPMSLKAMQDFSDTMTIRSTQMYSSTLMIGVMAQRHLAVETQNWSRSNGESLCPPELRGSGPACEAFDGCPDTRQLCIKGQCEYVLTVPRPAIPLRQNHDRGDGTFDAFRMPLLRPGGQHGVYNSQPFRIFDHDTYAANYTIRYLATGALESTIPGDVTAVPLPYPPILRTVNQTHRASLGLRPCGVTDVKVCSPRCLEAWNIRTPDISDCQY